MINFNEETLAKAKQAKSVKELLTLAKESDVEITAEQAQEIFARLNQKSGELSDDELDNVAGGGCHNGEGYLVVTAAHSCDLWKCKKCGSTELQMNINGAKIICSNGDSYQACAHCSYCISQAGLLICTNPRNRH